MLSAMARRLLTVKVDQGEANRAHYAGGAGGTQLYLQAAQKGRPARLPRVKIGGDTHRTSWSSLPVQWILANGKTPPEIPISENLFER